jgi:hypothetical protein
VIQRDIISIKILSCDCRYMSKRFLRVHYATGCTPQRCIFLCISSHSRHVSALIIGHHQVIPQNIKIEALFIQRIRCVEWCMYRQHFQYGLRLSCRTTCQYILERSYAEALCYKILTLIPYSQLVLCVYTYTRFITLSLITTCFGCIEPSSGELNTIH